MILLSEADKRYITGRLAKDFSLEEVVAKAALEANRWNYSKTAAGLRKRAEAEREQQEKERRDEDYFTCKSLEFGLFYDLVVRPEVARFCEQGKDFDALRNYSHFTILQGFLLYDLFTIEWESFPFMGEVELRLKLYRKSGIPHVKVAGYTQEEMLCRAVYYVATRYVYDETAVGESENKDYQDGKRAVLQARKEREKSATNSRGD